MTQRFTAAVWPEGRLWVAQCQEVDVASQGGSQAEALANLREALELYLEEPRPTRRVGRFELVPVRVRTHEARAVA